MKITGAWRLGAAVCLFVLAGGMAAAATGGNGFYRVIVQDTAGGVGIGVYTVQTDSMHPITGSLGPQNVLFGGGSPGTSYLTIRSFTSGTDYAQRGDNASLNISAGAPTTLFLEGFVTPGDEAVPVGDPNSPSGFLTTYGIGSAASAPDDLTVVQEVSVSGTDFNSSVVKVRTSITNNGAAAVELGVRYLWDLQIGANDDGPSFQAKNPDGSVLGAETDFLSPGFDTYIVQDNNDPSDFSCFSSNSPFPFFDVQGSVTGPAALSPTVPTRLAYVDWLASSGLPGGTTAANAFDYVIGGVDTSTCTTSDDDSAVMYWWGHDPASALVVPAGATIDVSAYIFAHLPGAPPVFTPPGVEGPPGDPTCEDGVDNDGDGLVDGEDPNCMVSSNEPPDCSAAEPSRAQLWPPNHKFRDVGIEGVVDPDGDPVSIVITGISQDEELNGLGDGNTNVDAQGVGTDTARLRSERSGLGDGRVYHILFTAEDGNGGTCDGEVTVCVPHDRGRGRVCVDQGPLFDSTGGTIVPENQTPVAGQRRHQPGDQPQPPRWQDFGGGSVRRR